MYEKGFIHSKTISIDNRLAFIGTVNMDIRSFYLNFEITSIIHETDLCKNLEHSFEKDKKNSRLITLKQWENISASQKALNSVCRLMAALL